MIPMLPSPSYAASRATETTIEAAGSAPVRSAEGAGENMSEEKDPARCCRCQEAGYAVPQAKGRADISPHRDEADSMIRYDISDADLDAFIEAESPGLAR